MPVDPKRQQLVHRIDVDTVDPEDRVALVCVEHERVQEPSLLEIEPVYLVPRRRDEGVAGRVVIGDGPPETGDARPVVEAALRVQLDRAVVLEVDRLCPVVGQYLSFS